MSSSPINIAGDRKGSASGDSTPVGSPGSFLIPSPVPCKRTRTYSACERIAAGPSFVGEMKSFCREKGHGFILYEGEKLFCHISDIDGDYIPQAGDKVSFKKAAIPPKKWEILRSSRDHPWACSKRKEARNLGFTHPKKLSDWAVILDYKEHKARERKRGVPIS